MKIGICDDQKATRDLIKKYILDVTGSHSIYEFRSGEELLSFIKNDEDLDIVFLDIDFKDGFDGMEIAKQIKGAQIDEAVVGGGLPFIVFVTGYPERMQDAFDVRAFQFLVKPVDQGKFSLVLLQAEKEIKNLKAHNHVSGEYVISINGRKQMIDKNRIRYIESVGRKARLCMDDEDVEIYARMPDIVSDLGDGFFQTHRSFIVNLDAVIGYEKSEVRLRDGMKVPLSRHKYREFLDAYMVRVGK